MCSLFEMENYEAGDLTDIVRAGRRSNNNNYGNCKTEDDDQDHPAAAAAAASSLISTSSDHHHHHHHHIIRQYWQFSSQLEDEVDNQDYSFGDPFCAAAAIRDPLDLIHHHHLINTIMSSDDKSGGGSGFNSSHQQQQQQQQIVHDQDELLKRPCNIFSRMLQISPATPTIITNKFPIISSPSPNSDSTPASLLIPNCNNNNISSPTTNNHPLIHANHPFLDNNNNPSALQISSPRNPAGIKRRKSQARKVVCVPAPVAASSRPNGEVIPSDLWAWRKYGQKPIKGSPYPRGYYRCSSSKGCSARKQVERSRTDPNMLVITYTSEHNHPWPTQRNALAGSSRSQQSKNTSNNSSTTKLLLSSDKNKEGTRSSSSSAAAASNNNNVKEEAVDQELIEKQQFETTEDHGDHHQLISTTTSTEGFQYRVAIPNNSNNQSDDFFADLEELETDPLNLLFTQPQKLDQITKAPGCLDDVVAFNNLFDWPGAENNNNSNNSNNSFQEQPPSATKRGFY